jgi:hypothetical protein
MNGAGSKHGWVTVEAYREFVAPDRLRIRNCWCSIE